MDAERIMERVRRLLAIANDPAASDNEQRIALEQAQRLMDRHAIEEWQLEEDHDAIEIIRRMIHLEANPCNWYMAELANIVALGNRCRASYGWRRAGNGRNVVCSISIYGARSDVDKTEAIWTAMETSRAAMWRERARTTPRAKANAAWRNGYYRGFQEEIARRYQILRREMESDGAGREIAHGYDSGLTRARRAVTRRISLMESPLTDEELLLLDGWSPTPTALWRLKARGSID